MLGWALNLGFAASGAGAGGTTPSVANHQGISLLIGTGCWLAPLVAAVLLGTR